MRCDDVLRNRAESDQLFVYNQATAVNDSIGDLEWPTFEYFLSTVVESGEC